MPTLAQIREKVRQRADIQNEKKRYPDSELDRYINDSYKELYATLVRHSLIREEAQQRITADGSVAYNLEDNHYSTLGVFKEESRHYRRLRKHSHRHRPHGAQEAINGEAFRYRIAKSGGVKRIELVPRPQNGVYVLVYVPILADLTEEDEMDAVLSYDEYVVIDAAIKALRKENSDTSNLMSEKAAIEVRIIAAAEAEEMTEAYTIARSRRRHDHFTIAADPANFRWYLNGDDY
jgi:hypothetical protein